MWMYILPIKRCNVTSPRYLLAKNSIRPVNVSFDTVSSDSTLGPFFSPSKRTPLMLIRRIHCATKNNIPNINECSRMPTNSKRICTLISWKFRWRRTSLVFLSFPFFRMYMETHIIVYGNKTDAGRFTIRGGAFSEIAAPSDQIVRGRI